MSSLGLTVTREQWLAQWMRVANASFMAERSSLRRGTILVRQAFFDKGALGGVVHDSAITVR